MRAGYPDTGRPRCRTRRSSSSPSIVRRNCCCRAGRSHP